MPFFCIKVKSKVTLAIFLLVTVFSVICFDFLNSVAVSHSAITNDDRIAFLKELGYNTSNNQPREKSIVIPTHFGDVFKNYNELQIMAGYNLEKYRGKQAKLFSYKILSNEGNATEYNANIIVYENIIIGGDISSVDIDGNMLPLWEKDKNENSTT